MVKLKISNGLRTQFRMAGLPARLGGSVELGAGGSVSYDLLPAEWDALRPQLEKSTLIRLCRADSPQASVPLTNKVSAVFSTEAQAARSAASDSTAKDLEALRSQFSSLQADVAAALSGGRGDALAGLSSRLDDLDARFTALDVRLSALDTALSGTKSDLEALTALVSAPAAPASPDPAT